MDGDIARGLARSSCLGLLLASTSGWAQDVRSAEPTASPGETAALTLATDCAQQTPPQFVELAVTVARPPTGPVSAVLDYKIAEVCVGAQGPRRVRWTLQDLDPATTLFVAWRPTAQNRVNYFQLLDNGRRQVSVAGVTGNPQAGKVWEYELVVALGDGNAIVVDPQIVWK